MAYIEKRDRRASWRVRYRDPAGRMRSKSFRRKYDAEVFASVVETELAHGTWTNPDRGKITVGQWAETWLQSKVDLRPSTLVRLHSVVKTHVIPEFGKYPLNRVRNSDLRAWVSRLSAEGYSPTTVRKSFNALSQMMRAAVSDRRITFNPCLDVPLPAERHTEQRFLDVSQVDRLAAEIEPRFRASRPPQARRGPVADAPAPPRTRSPQHSPYRASQRPIRRPRLGRRGALTTSASLPIAPWQRGGRAVGEAGRPRA